MGNGGGHWSDTLVWFFRYLLGLNALPTASCLSPRLSYCDSSPLARRSLGYTAFNSFPALPDRWRLPEGISDRDKDALYNRHCFPDISMIVERVEEIRHTDAGNGLTNAYIMTNGSPSWVAKLKAALRAKHSWANIASSRDLVLTPEQKYVSQALDMLVAQRAQVFIGNGVSTCGLSLGGALPISGLEFASVR